MQNRCRVINKLALVLLSIVVLELVLIGDQVQPVKAIKKKIALKKLKKLLPLLALVKPKKKIILVPIPFPMFKNHGVYQRQPHYPQQQQQHTTVQQSRPHSTSMMLDGTAPPMSFVMMQEPNGLMLDSMMQLAPNSMMQPTMPLASPGGANSSGAGFGFGADEGGQPPMMSMLMPSMTMSIQSEANGNSAIELSTNLMPNSQSGSNSTGSSRLRAPLGPSASKWRPNFEQLYDEASSADFQHQQHQHQQQQQQQQQQHNQAPGGEQYYSSPWSAKSPLSSPAKVYRQRAPQSGRLQQQTRQEPAAPKAVIMIRNQWRPQLHHERNQPQQHQQQQYQFQQQQLMQAPEIEELVPVGPAQLLPVYQTSNGQLHMSPPPPPPAAAHRPTNTEEPRNQSPPASSSNHNNNNADSEVALLGDRPQSQHQSPGNSRAKAGRLISPSAAIKGKQQQQQSASGGGY